MRKKSIWLIALVPLFFWGNVSAEEGILAKENFSSSVWFTTEYVFRGISNTSENPAVQGSFDYSHPIGAYLCAWASNTDFSKGNIEIDYIAGYQGEFRKDFGYDISAIYYSFPSSGDDPKPDYFEGHLGLSYQFSGAPLAPVLGAGYNYSPDFFGEDGDGHYVSGTLSLSLPYAFGLGAVIGYQDVEGGELTGNGNGENGGSGYDYLHWSVSLSREILGFTLDLTYHDTNEEDFFGDIAGSRVVFTVSRTF